MGAGISGGGPRGPLKPGRRDQGGALGRPARGGSTAGASITGHGEWRWWLPVSSIRAGEHRFDYTYDRHASWEHQMHDIDLGFLHDGPHQRQLLDNGAMATVVHGPSGRRQKQAIEGRENRGELTSEHRDGSEASGWSGGVMRIQRWRRRSGLGEAPETTDRSGGCRRSERKQKTWQWRCGSPSSMQWRG